MGIAKKCCVLNIVYCCVLNFVLLCIELCHYLCLFCTLAFLQIWQVCGRGGFPHIFLALIWAMPVSMPVLCLESHSQTLPVKVTKWPSSSTMHVRDMQALWHASGWGWGWFVYPRANSKTLNLIHKSQSCKWIFSASSRKKTVISNPL